MQEITCSGALFYSLDSQRFLFLHRTRGKHSNVWGIAGGNLEKLETAWQGAEREIREEIGEVDILKIIPLEKFLARDNDFSFHTYLCIIEKEFIPDLNLEHDGYAWVAYKKWPRPLHYGLKNTLQKKHNLSKIETVFHLGELLNK